MDGTTRRLLARMPLAEATLWVWRWVADELKAPRQKRRARPPRSARGKHVSAHQIIQANQAQAKPSQRKRV